MKDRQLPPALMANLNNVLAGKRAATQPQEEEHSPLAEATDGPRKPIVLITSADGIDSQGLTVLVEALVRGGQCDVYVCAPESDMSTSAHSVTINRTLAATCVQIEGATAFEVSGYAADCVSLALSGALFSWSKPALVISGINKGPNCGDRIIYSGAVAGAREALMFGVPSLAISLNWQKDVSQETDFKDAVDACLPLIKTAIQDVEKGLFPQKYLLNIEIPTAPSKNKGFKLTRQSFWRSTLSWKAISKNRHPPGSFMSMHQGLGIQLAQLSRDASAAGAARRTGKSMETESDSAAGKPENKEVVKKLFCLEFLEKNKEALDDDLDISTLENGFITVTPLHLETHGNSEIQACVSDWLSSALKECQQVS
ncbi:hypothetical protein Cni_G29204 [Canna indica]|uniref:Survival protein SurE-like phosphatase/nucleotidase domain-containing protein n=1 Tax=Canna indica TaxID=4628 RepID=A0AAQ3QR17_9LILI|nr:hypothetical protein Cni_G29204 [Canna indica]